MPVKKNRPDGTLLVLVVILAVFGLVLLYSTSTYNGRVKFDDPAYYFKKQLFATILGVIAMAAVSRIDYHILLKFAPAVYAVSLGLSLAVLFVGQEINGSKRCSFSHTVSRRPGKRRITCSLWCARWDGFFRLWGWWAPTI